MNPPSPQTLARHGITEDQWWALYEKQGGCCAVCRKPPAKGGRFHIDHDHAAARKGLPAVRGLLHPLCNGKLGKIRDDAAWCRGAADYLDAPPGLDLIATPYPVPKKRAVRRR